MKYLLIILTMGFFSLFFKKKGDNKKPIRSEKIEIRELNPVKYDKQLEVFNSLGYNFNEGVNKEMILSTVYEMSWEKETEKYIEDNPFSILYYTFGWRDPIVPKYNFSDKCIWFDLDYFDPNSQYIWFMERMGAITNGEINFEEISITTDNENWEWIEFKVNGVSKKWKLEKTGYIADHFIQRFSYLPKELHTKRRYTYFDDGGQQFVIDYASNKEQKVFNQKTGLNRKWLGEGNHFSEPKE